MRAASVSACASPAAFANVCSHLRTGRRKTGSDQRISEVGQSRINVGEIVEGAAAIRFCLYSLFETPLQSLSSGRVCTEVYLLESTDHTHLACAKQQNPAYWGHSCLSKVLARDAGRNDNRWNKSIPVFIAKC